MCYVEISLIIAILLLIGSIQGLVVLVMKEHCTVTGTGGHLSAPGPASILDIFSAPSGWEIIIL